MTISTFIVRVVTVNRFQEAAKVVNAIPVDKFPLLLNRIIQKLHLKVNVAIREPIL